jgi:CRISPR-associated protein Cas1
MNEPGTVLRKDGGRFVVSSGEEKLVDIPINTLESMVMYSGANITPQCINTFIDKGIPLTYVSSNGKYIGKLETVSFYNIERQTVQFERYSNVNFCKAMSERVIKAKIQNSKVILKRHIKADNENFLNEIICALDGYKNKVSKAETIEEIRGLEGMAAKEYFRAVSVIIKEPFCFEGRSKNPPTDEFNALLSYGYMLLHNEIHNSITARGLHPFIGFMHRIRNGHAALASDLMEEWRANIVDSMMIELVNDKVIQLRDFNKNDANQGVYLEHSKTKEVLRYFESKMLGKNSYSKLAVNSITNRQVIQNQISAYISALEKEAPQEYKTFVIR